MVYGKDCAIGAYSQAVEEILMKLQNNELDNGQLNVNDAKEIGIEDLISTNNFPSQSAPHVTTPTASVTSKGRKRKASVDVKTLSDCIIQVADVLSINMIKLGEMLSKSLEANIHE
ncbi:hypothetical protein Nepgr_029885 [Nepenthes gracilis]|uniref:Uncharacterized protein n=1 Tax=Nepenthes gracilis TaxID=150966 RepID=A0AAD3TER9_NEPGR|nr:hypothetical protein Nepgr_029885 [Nepenthes gracilis]